MEKQIVENAAPHSVALTTNAKGKVQVEVKVYADTPDAAATQALATLRKVRSELGADLAQG